MVFAGVVLRYDSVGHPAIVRETGRAAQLTGVRIDEWSRPDERRQAARPSVAASERPHRYGTPGAACECFSAVTGIAPRFSGSSLRPSGITGTTTSRRVVASTSCPRPP